MSARTVARIVPVLALTCVLLVPSLAAASGAGSPASEKAVRRSQLGFGVGMMVAGAFAISTQSGAGVLPPELLWFDLSTIYRYRVNPYFAAGGGAMLTLGSVADTHGGRLFLAGGQLLGTVRAYFVPDWLYFDFSLMVGYPLLYAFAPGIGLSIPMGDSVSLFLNNEFEMTYLGVFVGLYKPTLGLEFRF